jgi:hypothetical protein
METIRHDPSEDPPFGEIETLPFGNIGGNTRCSICGHTTEGVMWKLILWTDSSTYHELFLCRTDHNCEAAAIGRLGKLGGYFRHEKISTTPIIDKHNLPIPETPKLKLPYPEDGLFMNLRRMFGDPNGREMINATIHCCNAKRQREGEKPIHRCTAMSQPRFILEVSGFHALIHVAEAITITRGNKEGHNRRATEIGFFAALKALASWQLQKDEETMALMFASNAYNAARLKTLGLNKPEDNKFLFSMMGEDNYHQFQVWMVDWASVLLRRIEHLGLKPKTNVNQGPADPSHHPRGGHFS